MAVSYVLHSCSGNYEFWMVVLLGVSYGSTSNLDVFEDEEGPSGELKNGVYLSVSIIGLCYSFLLLLADPPTHQLIQVPRHINCDSRGFYICFLYFRSKRALFG